tara:strand:+ start:2586 stop:3464 length:879 start_codon:yes stop_codon:yes gene_type:complete
MKKISKAIIPVAGLGTRMLPATKAIPKELLPILDKPLIQYIVEEAIQAGINEIIFITRSGKEAIENHFDVNYELEHFLESSGKDKILKSIKNLIPNKIIVSSIKQEKPLGLGHAILCADDMLKGEDFAVLLPDEVIFTKSKKSDFFKMMELYKKNNLGQILVEKTENSELNNYGVVDLEKRNLKINLPKKISRIVEKPLPKTAPSNYRVIGRYILPYEVMPLLSKTSPDKSGEIQLTDAIDELVSKGKNSINAVLTSSQIFDCGSKKGFLGANIAMASVDKDLKKYLKDMIK